MIQVDKLEKAIAKYLKQGLLTDDYLLDNVPKLMACIRDANVTIRWLMLHTHVDVCLHQAVPYDI